MRHFKQYYLGCLAHASYLVGDGGIAVIVDPQRDVDQYIEDARALGLEIGHIVETHLHADFVSGHVELARRTGATIHIGHRAGAAFPHQPMREGDEILLGATTLRVLETPGHTPEGISLLVVEDGLPRKVLTGDTLFIGDVGRPDLIGSKGFSAEQMARMLFHSLNEKLLVLPDDVEVFPAHGAGSACGRFMSNERSSTIGAQRRDNYALQAGDEATFVELVTRALPAPPPYFAHDAETNRLGAEPLPAVGTLPALAPAAVEARLRDGALVLDVRAAAEFALGHVPGSVQIGLDGQFAPWVGALLPVSATIVIVAESAERAQQAAVRLGRVGYERVLGWLDGGVEAWARSGRDVAVLAQISVDELQRRLLAGDSTPVIDVRLPAEHADGHVPAARNQPLAEIGRWGQGLPSEAPAYLICAGGYRSAAAASLLMRSGHPRVVNVIGGHAAWIAAQLPMELGSSASAEISAG